MTDVDLADQIERWLDDDPDHMGLHSLSEAQWRGIIVALRRQHETNIRRANESLNGPERQPSSDQVLVPRSFAHTLSCRMETDAIIGDERSLARRLRDMLAAAEAEVSDYKEKKGP